MSKFLIIYSSVHGQTLKVTNYLADKLAQQGHQVTTASIDDVPALDEFDKLVLGASIRHGKHNPSVYDFITEHQTVLEQKPSSFFSVSLVARKPAKNTPETNPYMQAFLAKSQWQPKLLEVFGGNLNYQGYNAMDRNIIRFIMWITKGPTDAHTNVEYTDWQKVDRYADQLSAL
ncbi:menaquinone-dependent protoporphyrinogen IX dehydrogenase [Shewanella waksmanii]|uniref:menaquinone-dependent protoporphyrinogen IX dehydrogenase n=1 Tax=Shewanella waksmanii TaxID=213783 RepID=UPI003736336C